MKTERLYINNKLTRFNVVTYNNGSVSYIDTITGVEIKLLTLQRMIKYKEERDESYYNLVIKLMIKYDNTVKNKLENDEWIFDRRKTILVDMDDVLARFTYGARKFINEATGKNYTTEDFAKHYDMKDVLDKDDYNLLFNSPEVFEQLDVVDGSTRALDKLCAWYNIKIVSAAWWQCIPYKVLWLHKYFPFIKDEDMLFVRDKSIIIGDYLIDDYSKNIQNILNKNRERTLYYNLLDKQVETKCIMFKAERDDDIDFGIDDYRVKRMYSWDEVYNYLKLSNIIKK